MGISEIFANCKTFNTIVYSNKRVRNRKYFIITISSVTDIVNAPMFLTLYKCRDVPLLKLGVLKIMLISS